MSDSHSDQPVVIVERSESGLGGFLLGLAVGAGVALLFAPKTGEETRQQLKNTGRRLRTAASEKAEDLQEALGSGYEHTRDRIEEGLETARETISEKRDSARDALRAGKGAVKSARSELETLAKRLGLAERTRFTGFISDEERDALLVGSRVCVCPSEKEGWGLTVIEANCAGTPVVASDAPGLRDSVRHGETGFLVSGGVEAFAERIGELLADDALAMRMSRGALEWSARFDWERAASEMAVAIDAARAPR